MLENKKGCGAAQLGDTGFVSQIGDYTIITYTYKGFARVW